jgi:hypothetical protein
MALIVEDGTGLPGANAYIDISFLDSYFLGGRLEKWLSLSEANKEVHIVNATQFIDLSFEWNGNRKTLEQGLSWPRSGVVYEGFDVKGVPYKVKTATAECVWFSMEADSGELFSQEANETITSSQVGPIKITYATPVCLGSDNATQFDILNKALMGLYHVKTTGYSGAIESAEVLRK